MRSVPVVLGCIAPAVPKSLGCPHLIPRPAATTQPDARAPASNEPRLTVPLPPLTPEQRAAALEKAAAARRRRAEVKNSLKHSGATLDSVLRDGDSDDVIGKMKVSAVLEAMPGVG